MWYCDDSPAQTSGLLPEEIRRPQLRPRQALSDDGKEQILGENESLENVQTNLSLVSSTIYGIRVAWKSLTPEFLDDFGVIQIQDIEGR